MSYSRKTNCRNLSNSMEIFSLLTIIAYVLTPSLQVSLAIDSISLSHSISDGMTLVSKGETFELGFFSPGNSKKRYVGIWYKNIPIQTVVWVANRANPINDSSGILTVNSTGNLVLNHNNTVFWYTSSEKQARNPIAQLLDSGNLVVRDENEESPEGYLWQSFDHPSDTLLPGMKLGWDRRIGLNRNLTAWKSPDDPAPGDFSWVIKLTNYPESYLMKGAEQYTRAGPWNGLHFSGSPQIRPNAVFDFKFISNKDEVYYTYDVKNKSVITRLTLNQTTYLLLRYVWVETERIWQTYMKVPLDYCDNYGLCGVYGTCMITNSLVCQCLKGFRPKSPQAWNLLDWSQGCVRNESLSCMNNSTDGFIKLEGLKLPKTTHTWVDETIGLEECKIKCLNDCSCMAYTNSDIRGTGSGCAMWFGDLIDIREFSVGGQDLYIRIATSELEAENGQKKKLTIIVAVIISAISGILLFGSYYIYKARKNMTENKNLGVNINHINEEEKEDLELPLFELSRVAIATDNFSIKNKLGEGGFGPVYKGILDDGQEIAAKKLSSSSGQGLNEFKNEVILIAKLQHRNLVKLLGCCIQDEEKLLIYEYMPNKSLDYFIFDETQRKLLDWSKRFNIISGITRGLLYLHQDSRLRIIHRDLKASNVLLDSVMNPKISDFGLARSFIGDQSNNTNRVVGTYGYMAPEYALHGHFSVKSDVFSFGILLLEIVTGKKNREFICPNHINLIGHTWNLWQQGRSFELIDECLRDSCNVPQVLRCIHISLLCVQNHPQDRPIMSSVVLMLSSEISLPQPKLPSFFIEEHLGNGKSFLCTNDLSITELEAR